MKRGLVLCLSILLVVAVVAVAWATHNETVAATERLASRVAELERAMDDAQDKTRHENEDFERILRSIQGELDNALGQAEENNDRVDRSIRSLQSEVDDLRAAVDRAISRR